MKQILIILFSIAFLYTLSIQDISAQGIEGGVVKYQNITKLDFSKKLENNPDNQRLKDYLADLPEESVIQKTLSFTTKESVVKAVFSFMDGNIAASCPCKSSLLLKCL